jgi:hypothetical protein
MSRAFRSWWCGILLLVRLWATRLVAFFFAGGEIEGLALPFCISRISALYPRQVVA